MDSPLSRDFPIPSTPSDTAQDNSSDDDYGPYCRGGEPTVEEVATPATGSVKCVCEVSHFRVSMRARLTRHLDFRWVKTLPHYYAYDFRVYFAFADTEDGFRGIAFYEVAGNRCCGWVHGDCEDLEYWLDAGVDCFGFCLGTVYRKMIIWWEAIQTDV